MPIFEFACTACDHRFEELTRSGEDVPCPRCGGKTRRLFSTFSARGTSGSPADACACAPAGGG